jgi:integrating conjugative element protein (TIGR03758 family)
MDPTAAARFTAGAGVDPGALHGFAVSLAGAAVIGWAAWAIDGLYRQWRAESLDGLGLVAGTLRVGVVAMVIFWFLE